MTILPKKKPQQAVGGADESGETSQSSSHPHQLPSINSIPSHLQQQSEGARRGGLYLNSQSPPPCWPPPSSVPSTGREEKRAGHSSPSHYEETHEAPAPHSKRRYRASPLRSVRPKHRDHRGSASPPYPSTSGGWNVSSVTHTIPHPHQLQIPSPASIPALPADISPRAGPSRPAGAETDEDYTGYNSGDEYEHYDWNLTKEQWEEKERWFEKKMKKKSFTIKKMREDGACLFRAVADQIFGDEEMHGIIRKQCMDYILSNEEAFAPFVSENFHTYVERKKRDDCFGNHIEIVAMSEMFNRVIEVYCYSVEPINIFQGAYATDNAPIRLSYHGGTHYNSLVDPYKATVGVGLGLPEFHPGMADRNLMKEATRQSENIHIEQAMLQDKIRATDFEATTDAIEEQVAQESYLEWIRHNKHTKAQWSPSGASSSGPSEARGTRGRISPHQGSPREAGTSTSTRVSPRSSPRSCVNPRSSPPLIVDTPGANKSQQDLAVPGPSRDPVPSSSRASNIQGFTLKANSSFLTELSPDMFGLSDYQSDEIDTLAQVLAASQQEYLDSLKNKKDEGDDPSSSPKPSSSYS